jgi:[glutamine synthetase] adenylyltransferase / [glutamine synthetase]-adenylyl-L-tyrosine phosphorylase
LTRARVVWASSEAFGEAVGAAILAGLRQPRDPAATANDVREMRALMHRERPPSGFWDMKLSRGGLVDVEFAAQHLQLIHAGAGGPLCTHTADVLAAMGEAGLADLAALAALIAAWRLQQDLSQVLKLAFEEDVDPAEEPKGFRDRLARAGGVRRFSDLAPRLTRTRAAALLAYEAIVATESAGSGR